MIKGVILTKVRKTARWLHVTELLTAYVSIDYITRLNSKSTPWLPWGISCTKPVVVTAGYNIMGKTRRTVEKWRIQDESVRLGSVHYVVSTTDGYKRTYGSVLMQTGATPSMTFLLSPRKRGYCARYHPRNSGIEQWPARKAHNLEVDGSNPSPATKAVSTKPVVEWLKPLSRQCRCSVTESQCLLLTKHNTNIVR